MSNRYVPRALLAVALGALLPSGAVYAVDDCYWSPSGPAGPMRYVIDVGSVFVPRDAKIGDTIGQAEKYFILSGGGPAIFCQNETPKRLTFNATATAASVPLPATFGFAATGMVVRTNIPGVGVRIKLGGPYDGTGDGDWIPNSPDAVLPFDAYNDSYIPFTKQYSVLKGWFTLIKTADIDPGRHTLDSANELFRAAFTSIPYGWGIALGGAVTRAECTLSANPVSADPVQLGEWPTDAFSGAGSTTRATPFNLSLNACISDPASGGTQTSAYLRLEPTAGSSIVDASQGLFSLGQGATAKGVAIQVLNADAVTPLPLQTDISQGAIPVSGAMLLPLSARYYQTGPVTAGSANGALAFTITYK